MSDMRDDIASVLLSAEEIQARTAELGAQISRDFDGREPLFVGVLKGCFVFMADLMRSVTIPCSVDFMAVSSYGNQTTTTGAVKINKDLNQDIEGRDIILVEDILDSGVTLQSLHLQHPDAAALRAACEAAGLQGIPTTPGPAQIQVQLATPRGLVTLHS